jgi:predicted O-methyltransferase YrrM
VLKKILFVFRYLRYKLFASDEHGLHSPFVFELYTRVIRDETPFYIFEEIESVRAKMLLSDAKLQVQDFGTGGKKKSEKKLSLSFIAKHYVKPKKYGQLLFRLVNRFRPVNILELGTSLGITTQYLASPDSQAYVTTIEGCTNTAAAACENFRIAGIKNIEQITGEFSEVLPTVLKKSPKLDFVYFDGNHRKDATLLYFNQCLSSSHEHSVFVFDDIHWSREMEQAWKLVQHHESVTLTIDLFFIGLVFFRKGIPKQHFILKY